MPWTMRVSRASSSGYTYEMEENGVCANTVIHRHANIRKALQYAFRTDLMR